MVPAGFRITEEDCDGGAEAVAFPSKTNISGTIDKVPSLPSVDLF